MDQQVRPIDANALYDNKPYLIDAYKTEWFQVECTDGKTYVLIKKKKSI